MRSQAILQFNQKDQNNGKMLLEKKWVLKIISMFVFFVRDDNYLKKKFPDEMWNYHEHRNFDIDDFNSMMNLLIDRGYYVVRMGRDVKKRVSIINSKIIDYPFSSHVSDFADIYLMANCELCISTSTGPECVSRIFKNTCTDSSNNWINVY